MKTINPDFLTKNNMWDSDWLRKRYPERFDEYYLRKDLHDDQYDIALYNK